MNRKVDCINLKERFGERYRISWEEPATPHRNDPWYMQIPCRFGHIYPHGGGKLGFASDKVGAIAHRVAALLFTAVIQSASDGVNLTFDVKHFNEVAEIVKPRRRKRLSPEHRARLEETRVKFRRDNPDWKPGQSIDQSAQSDRKRKRPWATPNTMAGFWDA